MVLLLQSDVMMTHGLCLKSFTDCPQNDFHTSTQGYKSLLDVDWFSLNSPPIAYYSIFLQIIDLLGFLDHIKSLVLFFCLFIHLPKSRFLCPNIVLPTLYLSDLFSIFRFQIKRKSLEKTFQIQQIPLVLTNVQRTSVPS